MTDPFENYSTILRMRQSQQGIVHDPNITKSKELESKSTMDTTTESIGYENVDNYPTILRIREARDPMNSLGPIETVNTMVTGCRFAVEGPRTPYYTEGSDESQSETEASETTGSGSNTESSRESTAEILPSMMVPPGNVQPNLMIHSAMSLEDEKKSKYVHDDPIQEISITESNILESFSMQSYSMRSKDSRDTFDDNDDEDNETREKRTKEDVPKKPSSPLEASIMAMDAYYNRVVKTPRPVPTVDPRIEEMKQLMLTLWEKNKSSAKLLFSVSWQLTRRYRSLGMHPANTVPSKNEKETEKTLKKAQLPSIPLADLLLWRLFQRFVLNQGEIVVPLYLSPPAVDEFLISDWSNEIEGMQSDEISDSDLLMERLLSVDRVLSLEDIDDDEIFKFRKCITDEFRHRTENSDDDIPNLSDNDDSFRFRGLMEQNHYVFESGSSLSNSNLDSSQILTPLARYGPFSKLEKIIEEVSNGETESSTTSNRDETLPSSLEDILGSVNTASSEEGDTKSKDVTVEESLDAIIQIPTKSGAASADESNEDTMDYSQENTADCSQENTENSSDWGNVYSNSAGKSKVEGMPIESAFDIALRGVRSIDTENNSVKKESRRTVREVSIRSRGDYSIASEEQTYYLPEDCFSENLVDRFLYQLEVALCLR